MSDNKKVSLYYHFEQSWGGLFDFKTLTTLREFRGTTAIGTYNCQTCLGVFIKFEDGQVFIAHMIACTLPEKKDKDTKDLSDRQLDERDTLIWTTAGDQGKGQKLAQVVRAQLRAQLGSQDFGAPVMKESFVVCPDCLDKEQANGWSMKQGVEDFFNIEDLELRKGHGFIAKPGEAAQMLLWGNGDDRISGANKSKLVLPKHLGWKAGNGILSDDKKVNDGPWCFCYNKKEGEWEVRSV